MPTKQSTTRDDSNDAKKSSNKKINQSACNKNDEAALKLAAKMLTTIEKQKKK